MAKKWMVIVLGALLTLSACGGGGAEEDATGTTESGTTDTGGATATAAEAIFIKSCSGCHGKNLQGGMGPKLAQVGSKYTEEDILSIIQNGQGAMAGNIIQGEDAEAVAAWLAGMK